MPPTSRPKMPGALDLFAGCGGLTFGLIAAGFNVLGAVEEDSVAAAAYGYNFPGVPISVSDIEAIDPRKYRRQLGLAVGELALLAGCPPCQGFSSLRTRNGSRRIRDKRNHLVLQMIRFAAEFQPKVVLMENVPGVLRTKTFKSFCTALRKLGYQISFQVADAARFGVPQRRRRMLLLAGRGFDLPFPPGASTTVSVRDAIGELPQVGTSQDPLHEFGEDRSEGVRKLIKAIPKNGGGRFDLPRDLQLKCHLNFSGHKDTYGRMRWDAVGPTITTGCYNPSKGRFLHPEADRCITMREAALLQSFPASFVLPEGIGKTQAARMIGNAVPPELIRMHARVILQVLKRRDLLST